MILGSPGSKINLLVNTMLATQVVVSKTASTMAALIAALSVTTGGTGSITWTPMGVDSKGVARYTNLSQTVYALRPTLTISLKETSDKGPNGSTTVRVRLAYPREYTTLGVDVFRPSFQEFRAQFPMGMTEDQIAYEVSSFFGILLDPGLGVEPILRRNPIYG